METPNEEVIKATTSFGCLQFLTSMHVQSSQFFLSIFLLSSPSVPRVSCHGGHLWSMVSFHYNRTALGKIHTTQRKGPQRQGDGPLQEEEGRNQLYVHIYLLPHGPPPQPSGSSQSTKLSSLCFIAVSH